MTQLPLRRRIFADVTWADFLSKLLSTKFWAWTGASVIIGMLVGSPAPFHHASLLLSDGIQASIRQAEPTSVVDPIGIVAITTRDYRDLFNETSPLDKTRLAHLVAKILQASPRKLFVDIETDHQNFKGLATEIQANLTGSALDHWRDRVVWVSPLPSTDAQGSLREGNVILGRDRTERDASAAARILADADDRVRSVAVCDGGAKTLPALAAESLDGNSNLFDCGKNAEPFHPQLLGILPHIEQIHLSASDVLGGTPILKDKVVFLGGAYSADRFVLTDSRSHWGVDLLAASSLAMANKLELHEMDSRLEVMIDIISAILIAFVSHWLRPFWAWIAAVVFGFALSLTIGFVVASFGGILQLAVVLFVRMIEPGLDAAREAHHAELALVSAGDLTQESKTGRISGQRSED